MFQLAFGFVRLAPQPEFPAPPLGPFPPSLKRPFLNFARVGTIRERFAQPHTASHTLPQASSTKSPSPFRSTGCASRSAHPCSDGAPAAPRTKEPHRYTPRT